MGTRANVRVHDGDHPGVYLYQHWDGDGLVNTVQAALARQERWDDDQYLARIIFCQMVKDDIDGTTGYGISAWLGDGGDRIVDVDTATMTVRFKGGPAVSFADLVLAPDAVKALTA